MYNVTITAGGENVPVSSVENNINKALAAGRGYADFFLFGTDAGDKAEKSEIGDANTDPTSLPFVCYGATLASGSFDITSLSLSGDGINADYTVVFETPIKKRAGEKLNVEVRVALDCEYENAVFTSGDNPLVRWLLGMSELPSEAVIGLGSDRNPLFKVSPPFINYHRQFAADVHLDESGIKFTAQVNATPADAVLMLGGAAAMRARPIESGATLLSGTARVNDGGAFFSKEAGRITGVACGGSAVGSYELIRGRTILGGKSPVRAKVGSSPVLITDGDCKVAAAVSNGEAAVIRLSDGIPAVMYERKVYAKPCITTDGALFSLDGETLVFTAENGNEKRFGFSACDELVAVCSYAGQYEIAARSGNTVRTYTLSGGALTSSGEYTMRGTPCIGAIDGKRIAVCGKNFGCVIKGKSTNLSIDQFLAYVFDDFDVEYMRIFGQMMLFKDAFEGIEYAIDIIYGDGMDIYGDGEPVMGSDAVFYGGSLYLVNSAGNVHELSIDYKPYAFCRLGNYIMTADEDGALYVHPLGGSGVQIVSDSFTEGSMVSFVYSSPTVSSTASVVELGLSFEADGE